MGGGGTGGGVGAGGGVEITKRRLDILCMFFHPWQCLSVLLQPYGLTESITI